MHPDRKPRRDEEGELQRSLIQHLRLYADKRVLYWHTPNGGARSKATGRNLKAMGVLPGVLDLAFLLPDGSPAFLELKSKDGRLEPAQTDFMVKCEALGVPCAVASNIDVALEILTAWGVLKPSRA